ncbi:MAG: cyclic nucleotide-binding domain-containing protein [Myxococcales bacterium]|nr:cyclic nucleotide-binding domain-containing protein [Myxococcales bacterium]MCB9567975.1 cyclic nucleotide-binding domain-containing protein [Myxococcales bacterium]MCB9700420.1 cyclic nucleotide-binding domain-containing protein [Myxococcales bacterium]
MSVTDKQASAVDPVTDPARLGVFASLDPERWSRLLTYMEVKRFRPGDVLIKQGAVDRGMYIVREGRLAVLVAAKDGERVRRVGTIEAGSVVGEQALLDGKPRSATITALCECELLRLSFDAFRQLHATIPELAGTFLFELARVISLRFRTAQTDDSPSEG